MASGDPGTRTAPAWTATATDRMVALKLVDASGDEWSEPLRVPVATTAATLEAYAAAYQAGTQASLWATTDTAVREGAKARTNANTDQRNSVKQGINMLFSNPTTHVSQTPRLVAPVLAAMSGDLDIPLPGVTPLADLIDEYDVINAAYNFDSAQYTERRERKNNPRVS